MMCNLGAIALVVGGALVGWLLGMWDDVRKHNKFKTYLATRTREEYRRGFEFAAELCKLKQKNSEMHNKVVHLLTSGEVMTAERERQLVWEAER